MNEMLNAIPPVAYAIMIVIGFCALFGAAYYALKNGMLSSDALKIGTTVLEGLKQSAEALAKATGSGAISMTAFILDAGTRAAHAAEQMYKTGEIGKEERNRAAKAIAEDLLKLAGIEVTEDRKAALAVAIEAECDAMGHGTALSGVATVTGTPEEIGRLMEAANLKAEAQEEEVQTIAAGAGSLARGYDTAEGCAGDGAVYVGVAEDDGFAWKAIDACTEEELDAAIRANMPKADTTDMTREGKIALLEGLTDEA